jgi:hypothetical protein
MNKVRVFNTKRRYTEKGQRIAWTIVEDKDGQDYVIFVDIDRMIDGQFHLHTSRIKDDPYLGDQLVLNQYDHNQYRCSIDYEFVEQKKAIYEAARNA